MRYPQMTRVLLRRARSRDFAWMCDPTAYQRQVTPQAEAGLARSARARQARHVRDWGLLADAVQGPDPVGTVEERIARFNANAERTIQARRDRAADDWRRARAKIRELPPERASELVALWNERTAGGAWGIDLLVFLDERAPSPERVAERRAARIRDAGAHRRRAEQQQTWWIQHTACPEGEAGGVVKICTVPFRELRCIGCEAAWTKQTVADAEADGTLRVVDCRTAVQESMLL
jgi:hypothetical protein